jgi:hypothetical protein
LNPDLVRFGDIGCEKPRMLDRVGRVRDLSKLLTDIAGQALSRERLKALAEIDPSSLAMPTFFSRVSLRFGFSTLGASLQVSGQTAGAVVGLRLSSGGR